MSGAPTLLLLNGLPGIGKSTLARYHRDRSPGVLCADADELRAWIGGDQAVHAEAAQHLSLAMATAHLTTGHDVVLPQLVASPAQVARFARAAEAGGARFLHVVLTGEVVEARVPDEALAHLVDYAEGLAEVCRRPGVELVRIPGSDVTEAHARLVELVSTRSAPAEHRRH